MVIGTGRSTYTCSARATRERRSSTKTSSGRASSAPKSDDVFEARRRAVPFLLGGVFACAVEEHAEAARRAVLLCGGVSINHIIHMRARVGWLFGWLLDIGK
jgi:hypothetical protein